jgi:hypothetical protein
MTDGPSPEKTKASHIGEASAFPPKTWEFCQICDMANRNLFNVSDYVPLSTSRLCASAHCAYGCPLTQLTHHRGFKNDAGGSSTLDRQRNLGFNAA